MIASNLLFENDIDFRTGNLIESFVYQTVSMFNKLLAAILIAANYMGEFPL